jgi:hypothetical protein
MTHSKITDIQANTVTKWADPNQVFERMR